jgi:hypothetical protein
MPRHAAQQGCPRSRWQDQQRIDMNELSRGDLSAVLSQARYIRHRLLRQLHSTSCCTDSRSLESIGRPLMDLKIQERFAIREITKLVGASFWHRIYAPWRDGLIKTIDLKSNAKANSVRCPLNLADALVTREDRVERLRIPLRPGGCLKRDEVRAGELLSGHVSGR